MPGDQEVEVIRLIVEAFEALDEGARRRVHRFLNDRYGDPVEGLKSEELPRSDPVGAPTSAPAIAIQSLSDLEALFVGARTTAQWERALITGYWLQELRRQPYFDALAVNHAMRQSGYGISNITRELAKLTTWGLVVIQQPMEKGSGRRRFRVSQEGLRWCRHKFGLEV